jgi:hypothetical protein
MSLTSAVDPTVLRTRELAHLRLRAERVRRTVTPTADRDVMEDALCMCDSLLRDLADAQLESERLRVSADPANAGNVLKVHDVSDASSSGL